MGVGQAQIVEADSASVPAAVVVGGAVALTLFVAGRPEPLHRHRGRVVPASGSKKAWVQFYADPRSAAYEDEVANQVRRQVLGVEVSYPLGEGVDFKLPLTAMRILMTVRFNLVKPVSYPKRITMHTKKPDVDNYGKAILDGLVKGLVIKDDGMVTDLTTFKRYVEPGHPEGVEIDLTAVPTEVV